MEGRERELELKINQDYDSLYPLAQKSQISAMKKHGGKVI